MTEFIIFLVLYFITFLVYTVHNLGNKYPTKSDILIGYLFYPALGMFIILIIPFQLLFNFKESSKYWKQQIKSFFNF